MSNELVIDVSSAEISFALLEDKQLVELSKEKTNSQFSVGDIYLGRVRRIMSGLNAAFVDVGYEKDAFLHYLDLGPQFRSLGDYVSRAIAHRLNSSSLDKFDSFPDIDKKGKINEVLKEGQAVLVQVAKEPISTKGPRISSEISIAGRNLVLLPFSDKVSVSQKIKGREERERLRSLIQSIKPENYSVIVRTVAKNRRVAVLDAELRELVEKWEKVADKLGSANPPRLILGELGRASAIMRDLLNHSFSSIYLNDEKVYNEVKDYITAISPELQKIVKLYKGRAPIFEQFGITKQVKTLFGKTVTFKNGAYLIIEHTEALHVIDVNSGNRTKNSYDQETNALEVNIAAAGEIARQLRLRDMGGIIVVDFIDMHNTENRIALFEYMKKVMATDRTKHNILPLSKFGLMQITRQRVRPELSIETSESCPTCKGTGKIAPSILLSKEIENNLAYINEGLNISKIELKVHPYMHSYLTKGIFSIGLKWMWKYKKWINIKQDWSFAILDHKFFDSDGEELEF
ncbi:MAG: Rne/Rng family ribonuclease [Bacteroidales bacterium]|nr:Rne/Rng family ribonuclease [Bacteroidales bacterium]